MLLGHRETHYHAEVIAMRKIITVAALVILVSIVVLWSTGIFDRPRIVTEVEATEAAARISPFEMMTKRGKDLPVEKFTAEPF
jgi:hypothetical protein